MLSVWGLLCGVWLVVLLWKVLKMLIDMLSRMYVLLSLEGCEELVCLVVGYFMYDVIVLYKYYGM